MEKLSAMRPVPDAKRVWDHWCVPAQGFLIDPAFGVKGTYAKSQDYVSEVLEMLRPWNVSLFLKPFSHTVTSITLSPVRQAEVFVPQSTDIKTQGGTEGPYLYLKSVSYITYMWNL